MRLTQLRKKLGKEKKELESKKRDGGGKENGWRCEEGD